MTEIVIRINARGAVSRCTEASCTGGRATETVEQVKRKIAASWTLGVTLSQVIVFVSSVAVFSAGQS